MPDIGDTLISPRHIGPYAVDRVLGAGAMGVVYDAVTPDGRPVAIKVMQVAFADAEGARRFAREASVRIDHPNVIAVLDAGVDGSTPYIVFELLDGESFDAVLARGRLSFEEAGALGIQACAGLTAAHALGVVHRDLKPANLFRCRDGTVKLLDFGIALPLSRETRLTRAGGVVGTPSYLSPEQARGQLDIDARADLWALGAVLYEAISGRSPFGRETLLRTILAVVRDELPPLASVVPSVPRALAAVVERALAKPREGRWASAKDMGAALAAIGTEAAPSSFAAVRPSVSVVPGGEQRIVAVLLADAVQNVPALDRAVTERGGVLVPLLGGRAIGLFGAESWEGDEALRAVDAAVSARAAARYMAVASGRAKLHGSMVSGSVLSAAEDACAAGVAGVAVCAETVGAVSGRFALTRCSERVFEVTGAVVASGVAAPGDRALIGRQAEMAQLRDALRTVHEDRRALGVLVLGPPGIGKSRLRRALEEMLDEAPVTFRVLTGRAEGVRRRAYLSLFAAVLRGRAQIDLGASTAMADTVPAGVVPVSEVWRLAREALGGSASALAPFLGEIMGVPMPENETPQALRAARGDPQLMADRLRMTLLDYFAGLAGKGPLALVLEDIQWADAASIEMIGDLLDRLGGGPFLLLATARSELVDATPDLFGGRDVVRVTPRGLSANDAALLASRIADRDLPEPLARAIAERSGGNPLFVEQLVRALGEQMDVDTANLPLPLTVEAAVQSRLDHLPAAEKEVCKRAALFGRPFSDRELEALEVDDAAGHLSALARREIIVARGRSSSGVRVHQFRSALVAEVAYRMISDDVRDELHRRVAALLASRADADPEEVASHHERGGEAARAAERYAEAALRALAHGDSAAVLRCSERAFALGAPAAVLFGLHVARADVLSSAGRRDDQGDALELALVHATTDADRARVLTRQCLLRARIGKTEDAIRIGDAAVAAARAADDLDVLALAHARAGSAQVYGGRLAEAGEAIAEARRLVPRVSVQSRAVVADASAELAGALGDLGARRDGFAEAARLYAEIGDVRHASSAEANLADVYNRVGGYAEAETALRAAIDGCRRVGSRAMEGYALANLGYALAMLERTDEALHAIDDAETIGRATRDGRLCFFARIYRCRARLGRDPSADVARDADAIAAEGERQGFAAWRALALSIATRAHLAAGDVTAALDRSELALALLEKLGGVEEDEAEVYLARVDSLAAAGRADEAQQVFGRAARRVSEISASIIDPTWRRRFLGDVPAHRRLTSERG